MAGPRLLISINIGWAETNNKQWDRLGPDGQIFCNWIGWAHTIIFQWDRVGPPLLLVNRIG